MPQKPERMPMIRNYLINATVTMQPSFRELSQKSVMWKWQGYEDNPAKGLLSTYEILEFKDLYVFYKQYIQNKPIRIGIVGDTQRMKVKNLSKFGRLVPIKEEQLFKD
jgi:predicted Zn-dependent peptidase